ESCERCGAARPKTSRTTCDGVTPTTTGLPATASARLEGTSTDGPRRTPGRLRDSRWVSMWHAASGFRHQSLTECERPPTWENILASAAPNAPAPNTAISMNPSYQLCKDARRAYNWSAMSRRVAVVDDDRDIRDALRGALTDEGYDVTVVPNGLRLLSALE